jgi:hypothetical protein
MSPGFPYLFFDLLMTREQFPLEEFLKQGFWVLYASTNGDKNHYYGIVVSESVNLYKA